MEKSCEQEVRGFHAFLRDWLAGAVPRTAETFARFSGVMGDGLEVIGPRGTVTGREALVSEFEGLHGELAADADAFEIWIENFPLPLGRGRSCAGHLRGMAPAPGRDIRAPLDRPLSPRGGCALRRGMAACPRDLAAGARAGGRRALPRERLSTPERPRRPMTAPATIEPSTHAVAEPGAGSVARL